MVLIGLLGVSKMVGLDGDNLPVSEGVYSIKDNPLDAQNSEIDVYYHPIKGFCCFSEDFGSSGAGVSDETDCHVSVQCTGLEFIERVGDLK